MHAGHWSGGKGGGAPTTVSAATMCQRHVLGLQWEIQSVVNRVAGLLYLRNKVWGLTSELSLNYDVSGEAAH